jgi:hypothetical protein
MSVASAPAPACVSISISAAAAVVSAPEVSTASAVLAAWSCCITLRWWAGVDSGVSRREERSSPSLESVALVGVDALLESWPPVVGALAAPLPAAARWKPSAQSVLSADMSRAWTRYEGFAVSRN